MGDLNVTEWSHPDCDMKLFLEGTAKETRDEAVQIMAPDSDVEPTAYETRISREAFEKMPEFDG